MSAPRRAAKNISQLAIPFHCFSKRLVLSPSKLSRPVPRFRLRSCDSASVIQGRVLFQGMTFREFACVEDTREKLDTQRLLKISFSTAHQLTSSQNCKVRPANMDVQFPRVSKPPGSSPGKEQKFLCASADVVLTH